MSRVPGALGATPVRGEITKATCARIALCTHLTRTRRRARLMMSAPVPDPAPPRVRTIRHVLRDLRVDQPGAAVARAVCSEGVHDFNKPADDAILACSKPISVQDRQC